VGRMATPANCFKRYLERSNVVPGNNGREALGMRFSRANSPTLPFRTLLRATVVALRKSKSPPSRRKRGKGGAPCWLAHQLIRVSPDVSRMKKMNISILLRAEPPVDWLARALILAFLWSCFVTLVSNPRKFPSPGKVRHSAATFSRRNPGEKTL
jgi:hypothetical protein